MNCPDLNGKDPNGDGLMTISDIWFMLGHAYHWPGNTLVELVGGNPKLAEFFELSLQSCSGWFSFAISTLVWLVLLGVAKAMDG